MSKSKTYKIHALVLILGLVFLVIGIVWATINPDTNAYIFLVTIGSTVFGLGLSWRVEEYLKKIDDRKDALELFERSVILAEDKRTQKEPKESNIAIFRKSPFHFYYSTKSIDGKLFWNYVVLNFGSESFIELGVCKTHSVFIDFDRSKKLAYTTELTRENLTDNIILFHRSIENQEPTLVTILRPNTSYNQYTLAGFSYHDDWMEVWRLSPSLLLSEPIIKNQKPGPCKDKVSIRLQEMWNDRFVKTSKHVIFEEYRGRENK